MPRESRRTLFSLSQNYQQDVDPSFWEVIAIDNGSTEPLNEEDVTKYSNNFRYFYFETDSKSPVNAINFGINQARGDYVSISIDGARILSPGIMRYTRDCCAAFDNPFICTLGWHLGKELQNISMLSGYNQAIEDKLLDTVDWKSDGYKLFDISTLAGSSSSGYFSPINESNFMTLKKTLFLREGGFDTRFTAPGGGAANLDFYKRISEIQNVDTIHLLGEGTFHQFHGGVATNVPLDQHPGPTNQAQYESIRKIKLTPSSIEPIFFGKMPAPAMRFVSKL